MSSQEIKNQKKPQSVKVGVANLVKRKARRGTGRNIKVKGDRISLKALALISSWNKYSNQSIISKVYHKIVNSIRRI